MNTKRRVTQETDQIYEFALGKSALTPGVEVSLRGKRGRFRFQYLRRTAGGDELTFVGGPMHGQRERFVSVYPDCIMRVHSDRKTLVNIQRERKGITK